jgi:methionine-rich copper-binding protein CopC
MKEPMNTRLPQRAALVAVAVSLALPAGAAAHAGIKSRSPKAGGTASRSLGAVRVTFTDRVLDANLTVRTAAGRVVSIGSGSLNNGKTRVRVRLRSGLSAGRYRASVRFLADDGHPQQASWSFRLR